MKKNREEKNEQEPLSPYLCGVLTGLLMVFTVVNADKFFGASTSFGNVAGLILEKIIPAYVAKNEYFLKNSIYSTWQLMFLLGIFLGSFISAVFSGTFKFSILPKMWKNKFPKGSALTRIFIAFIGGMIALFGARMAGGCPSGHGLSGIMQGAVGGFIALFMFFAGGMISAKIIYGNDKEI